jgi:hypothetical protein
VIVAVDRVSSVVTLEDPSDCARFHVVADGPPDIAALGAVLAGAGVGHADGDDAVVEIAAVRALAAGRVEPGWEADFAAMVDYARTKGWLDSTGEAIRAHVEWTS